MARAVDFIGTNLVLNPSPGTEDRVEPLRAFSNRQCVVTCWELTAEELADVLRTGKVFVSQWSGKTIFPTFVGNASSVRDVVSGYGLTIPQQE